MCPRWHRVFSGNPTIRPPLFLTLSLHSLRSFRVNNVIQSSDAAVPDFSVWKGSLWVFLSQQLKCVYVQCSLPERSFPKPYPLWTHSTFVSLQSCLHFLSTYLRASVMRQSRCNGKWMQAGRCSKLCPTPSRGGGRHADRHSWSGSSKGAALERITLDISPSVQPPLL